MKQARQDAEAPTGGLGLMRELDIIGDRERGIPGVFPVSRSYFRGLVRDGGFVKPIKVGKLSFWKRADVLAMLAKIAGSGAEEMK